MILTALLITLVLGCHHTKSVKKIRFFDVDSRKEFVVMGTDMEYFYTPSEPPGRSLIDVRINRGSDHVLSFYGIEDVVGETKIAEGVSHVRKIADGGSNSIAYILIKKISKRWSGCVIKVIRRSIDGIGKGPSLFRSMTILVYESPEMTCSTNHDSISGINVVKCSVQAPVAAKMLFEFTDNKTENPSKTIVKSIDEELFETTLTIQVKYPDEFEVNVFATLKVGDETYKLKQYVTNKAEKEISKRKDTSGDLKNNSSSDGRVIMGFLSKLLTGWRLCVTVIVATTTLICIMGLVIDRRIKHKKRLFDCNYYRTGVKNDSPLYVSPCEEVDSFTLKKLTQVKEVGGF